MPKQWVFAFVGGRFDGYRHVADPNQITPRQRPPEELHLWESEGMIRVCEYEGDVGTEDAERYCLRSIRRKQLEARYEHEAVRPSDGDETVEQLHRPAPLKREPEPIAA